MILEAIVTTTDSAGKLNVAPMGPCMEPGAERFELRPFETSQTFQNLCSNPYGVLHVTDDVYLFAAAAVHRLGTEPETTAATCGVGRILQNCCHWMEFSAQQLPSVQPRKSFSCNVESSGVHRPFFGFNRAKHAVLEATILATRIEFIPAGEFESQLPEWEKLIDKTGGPEERKAFTLIKNYVSEFGG